MGLAASAVLLVGGLALVLSSDAVSFGWFGSEPLPTDFLGDVVVLSRRQATGALIAVGGLVLASAVAGFAIGRGTARRP